MVEYLTIFEEKYPVRIGYHVMKSVQAETGKTLQEALVEAEQDITLHECILFAALEMGNYAMNKKLESPFPREEMEMIVDLCFNEYLALFESETFFPKEIKEKVIEQGKEKKKSGSS